MHNPAVTTRRPLTSRGSAWAAACARALLKLGISPNAISVASIFFAIGAAAFFYSSRSSGPWMLVLGALMVQGRLLCNLMDGMVAIEGGKKTKSGEIFNELPDRIADPIILVGAGYAIGSDELLGWLAATLALLTAYVRALGVTAGAGQQFCGPMAKPHRMAALTIGAIVAAGAIFAGRGMAILQVTLAVICLGCVATIWRRTARILRELESK